MNFDAVMGDGLREYGQKEVRNINTFIHGFYQPHYAFPFQRINITAEKRIPDESFYQKLIDWDKFRTQTDASIVRAGQGAGVDDYFFVNYAAMKKRGMLRGVYWFYDGRVSPGAQADLLASLLRDNLPEMEVWIDWERNYSGAFEGLQNVVAMMQRLEVILPGVKVGLYTGYYYFTGNSNPITHASQYAYLKTRSLWLAWYTADMSVVKIPNPWTALLLWQFGTPALGAQYGVATQEIDMSYFNGSTAEFYARYQAPQPPTGETMDYVKGTTKAADSAGGLKVRDAPETGNVIGFLPFGTAVEGWLSNSWIKGTFKGLTGYISALWVTYQVVAPPVPTEDVVDILVNGVKKYSITGKLTQF